MKDWIHVILSWVAVGLTWFVFIVTKYSAFLVGFSSLVALLFTLWQWNKSYQKEKRKKHHGNTN